MKWLITGGCGFIGTAVIQSLVREGGHDVRVLDNFAVGAPDDLRVVCDFSEGEADGPIPSGVQLVRGDIMDQELALRATEGADVILHLAANTGVEPSVKDPRYDCMTNVVGLLNYLEAARHNGTSRFVSASSGASLGAVDPPYHEELPAHPVSPYGASKVAGEGYCSAYYRTFGVDTVALRFGNVYGPLSGHKNSAVAKFIRRARNGEGIEIYGDGTQTRDYVFIDDLVRAITLSATVEGVGGEVFQIATSTETTVRELIDELLAVLATTGIEDVPVSQTIPRQGDVQRNYSDTSKAENLLGWKAQVALPDGLKRTVDWFMKQPA